MGSVRFWEAIIFSNPKNTPETSLEGKSSKHWQQWRTQVLLSTFGDVMGFFRGSMFLKKKRGFQATLDPDPYRKPIKQNMFPSWSWLSQGGVMISPWRRFLAFQYYLSRKDFWKSFDWHKRSYWRIRFQRGSNITSVGHNSLFENWNIGSGSAVHQKERDPANQLILRISFFRIQFYDFFTLQATTISIHIFPLERKIILKNEDW